MTVIDDALTRTASDSVLAQAPRRPGAVLVRRLRRKPAAVISASVIALFVLAALVGPLIAPADPDAQDYAALLQGPSASHWLGTDDLGRDVLARLLVGARISLVVALATTALVFAIGIPVGLVAGYYGGWIDAAVSRSVEIVLAFPYLIVAIGLSVILGPSILTVTVALAAAQLPWLVRIVRGEVLSLRESDFVAGAIVDGARDRTILFRHLLPSLSNQLIVVATLLIPFGILGEAMLSFLGLGVRPPTATWGVMLASAQPFAQSHPFLAIIPGVTIAVVALAFNLLGDNLRDVLDPRSLR